jgi:uncharacterized protein (TIRG00374 family)
MIKENKKIFLKLFITALFILYLSFSVDYAYIFEALKQMKVKMFLTSTALAFITTILISSKYFFSIKNTIIEQKYFTMIKINLISRFYGMLFPTSLGRGIARWYKVTQNKQGRLFFVEATIIERMTQNSTLLLFGLMSFFIWSSSMEIVEIRSNPYVLFIIVSFVSLNLAGIIFFFNPKFNYIVKTVVKKVLSFFINQQKILSFFDKYKIERRSLSLLATLFMLSIIWQVTFICRMYLLFQALSVPLHLFDVAWMSCLVLLLQMIPITFAGLGLREGAYAYLVTIFNVNPEKGALIGILFFSQLLFIGLIGWVLEVTEHPSKKIIEK